MSIPKSPWWPSRPTAVAGDGTHLGVGIAFTLVFVSREAGVKFFRFNAGLAPTLLAAPPPFPPPPPPRRTSSMCGGCPGRWLAVAVLVMQATFLVWLMLPGHLPRLSHSVLLSVASIVMVGSIYLIELFRLINVGSLCIASALAQDPVPMVPTAGSRVAFLTSIVPSSEPLSVLV